MQIHFLLRLVLIGIYFAIPASVSAHAFTYGTVSTQLDISRNTIQLQTEISRNIFVYGRPVEEEKMFFQNYFNENLHVSAQGSPCSFILSTWKQEPDQAHSFFEGTFTCPRTIDSIQDLEIHSDLCANIFQNFDHYMTLALSGEQYEIDFSAHAKDYPGTASARSLGSIIDYFIIVALKFVWMGIEHIWGGYDHILFLLSVVLLARSLKKILLLVTAFTLAHSITLILAGFHVFVLSSRIVEPAIAVTILYMAYRNLRLLQKPSPSEHELSERVPLTFAFGLIHGLGFAGALADTTIPQAFFVPALLFFNAGIELGQFAILTVALPILWSIDTTSYRRRILSVFSYTVAVVAFLWILQRIFLW